MADRLEAPYEVRRIKEDLFDLKYQQMETFARYVAQNFKQEEVDAKTVNDMAEALFQAAEVLVDTFTPESPAIEANKGVRL